MHFGCNAVLGTFFLESTKIYKHSKNKSGHVDYKNVGPKGDFCSLLNFFFTDCCVLMHFIVFQYFAKQFWK
jgi:hypothetical protein